MEANTAIQIFGNAASAVIALSMTMSSILTMLFPAIVIL